MRSLRMQRPILACLALLTALAAFGCGNEEATVNRLGVNIVAKELFQGSWYYSRTVIDVDYEAAGIGTYPGDAAMDFGDSSFASIPRIRWVIDEDTLFAFRDYELLEGGNPERPESGEHLGHPVAAFSIESHFDIRRAYSSTTGEEQNVVEENDYDRRWYERDYMRVDWSKNLMPGYYGQVANLYEVLGFYNREPADLFVQAHSDFPDSWQPRFDFMTCSGLADTACPADERDFAEDYEQGDLYHFSVVTQELLSPGQVPNPFTGGLMNWCISPYSDAPTCSTVAVYVRNSFLKVSDTRQYEPTNWVDTRFERHGYFRVERPTLDRMTAADDPAFGYTDYLNYNINRFNIWRDWYTEAADGSRTPVPYTERRVREIVYHTTPELPAHLVQPAFQLVGEWNIALMASIRSQRGQALPDYGRVECQTTEPDGYCFCNGYQPDTNGDGNGECAGRYDVFQSPAEAEAAGVTNPFDCWAEIPAGAEPDLDLHGLSDTDFYGWYDTAVQGSECALVLRMNTCTRASIEANGGTTDGMACQERGDARYKFISYVDQPGTAFLGVATLRGDPVTGELIVGDANIGGPALDGYRTSAMQAYDLINGTLTDDQFFIGEDVRGYLQSLNQVQQPNPPRTDFSVALVAGEESPTDRRAVQNRMDAFLGRAERLQGPEGRANTFVGRREALRGSEIEQRLMQSTETLAMAGINWIPEGYGPSDIGDEILDRVSPFRRSVHDMISHQAERDNAYAKANMMLPNEYVDNSVMEFVERHRDWSRPRLQIGVNRLLYYETQLHELGHCMGLRHDFGASSDTRNYFDDYYAINEAIPFPVPSDFEMDGVPGLNATEQVAWDSAYETAKQERELAGVDLWQNASVMEYTAQWYERTVTRAGRYDVAAINFGYGDMVELYDNAAGLNLADINPANTERVWARYYQGGEICSTDADCPYSSSGARGGDLVALNTATGLTQSCIPHPDGEATHGRVCSNFDDDAVAMTLASPRPAHALVEYRFCSDDRVGTLGWCHRFDEGDSFREVIHNLSEQYERQYIFTNFRRYRANFDIGGYLFNRLIGRQFNIMQDIFQSLLWRYQSDPGFRSDSNAFGFYDQFMATADILNFYGRILAQPDVGGYAWDTGWERYVRNSADPDSSAAQLGVDMGLGRYFGSVYQSGLTGIFRVERIGSFYDKWIVMQMLTERGWQQSYTRDVPFWTNYYDLFPVEMQQLFQGLIQDQPEVISPRLECEGTFPSCDNPQLVYMDLYRGDCSNPATCRPDPRDAYAGMPVLDGGSAVTLQFLATILALTEFPTFFDPSFQNQLYICVEGNGACFEPSPTAIEGTDYVRYYSQRFGKSFIAWQVEPALNVPNQTSIGFSMVKEAADADFIVYALRTYQGDFGGALNSITNLTPAERARLTTIGYPIPADARIGPEIDRINGRLLDLESFFFQMIQLENETGIASYLRF
ncbi:MAG: hypothetical protein OEY14_01785 [Myxococcales bacterium]|nr:hypothetical protein [Myxococcales bacterium]